MTCFTHCDNLNGMNNKYTLKTAVDSITKLKDELKREPTIQEIDQCDYTPSARQIQRRWGGIKGLRLSAGFQTNDHTKGDTRSNLAKIINDRANKYHLKYVDKLFKKYHDKNGTTTSVIREFAYQQWLPADGYYKNIACDVAIDDRPNSHITLIDFFYPQDTYSFGGCVRMKRSKLNKNPISLYDCTYSVVFVCMNPAFNQDVIDTHSSNKDDIKILSLKTFEDKFLS